MSKIVILCIKCLKLLEGSVLHMKQYNKLTKSNIQQLTAYTCTLIQTFKSSELYQTE